MSPPSDLVLALTPVVSALEDVILKKLEWYRLGGEVSDRQWNDAVGVLKVQRDRLDLEYLRLWAATWASPTSSRRQSTRRGCKPSNDGEP